MLNFERTRPFDEHRVMFKLFAQLLKEIRKLPMPEDTTQKVDHMQRETEDFLSKMRFDFNLDRFRVVADPKNPKEVV